MRIRKQDANGDYVAGTGADFYINEPAAVGLLVQTRLLLLLGECFYDLSQGTPWFQKIMGKYTATTFDLAIKDVIRKTDGVVSIESYSSQVDAQRKLSVMATINTIYGQTTVDTSVTT